MPTHIASGMEVTNFGAEPGNGTVTAVAVGVSGGAAITTLTFPCKPAIPVGQVDLVVGVYKAPFDFQILSVMETNTAVAGGADFDLYNDTDADVVLDNKLVASATADVYSGFAAAGVNFIQKDDVLHVRSTTDAGGTITDLRLVLTVQVTGAPDNL